VNGAKTKVLVVEDEPILAMSLEILLDTHGSYEVVGVADDLGTAVALADERPPDVALVDIQLARGSSGYDVAAELRSRGVAALFMTGNVPPEPRPDLTLGCLSKPFGDDALFRALEVARALASGDPPPARGLPPELEIY